MLGFPPCAWSNNLLLICLWHSCKKDVFPLSIYSWYSFNHITISECTQFLPIGKFPLNFKYAFSAKRLNTILLYRVYKKEWCGIPLFTIETAPFFCVYPVRTFNVYIKFLTVSRITLRTYGVQQKFSSFLLAYH
jgi:hypothetical protein